MLRWNWNPQSIDGWDRHLGATDIVGMVLMIILWAALLATLGFGIRALIIYARDNKPIKTGVEPQITDRTSSTPPSEKPETVVEVTTAASTGLLTVLQERYARGEIDREEFLQRKQDLGLT